MDFNIAVNGDLFSGLCPANRKWDITRDVCKTLMPPSSQIGIFLSPKGHNSV
jgi:hypothetical protein